MLILLLLEYTIKGYDHISDLLLANYRVITGCKYSCCTKLTKINIGKGVKEIGCRAFSGCSSLNEIILHSTKTPLVYDDTFWEIGVGGTIYIPKGSCKAYSNWMNDTSMTIFARDCKEINNY